MSRKCNVRYKICKYVIYTVINSVTVQIYYYDSYLHQNVWFFMIYFSGTIFMLLLNI